MTASPPRPAATVVVLRASTVGRHEVLLVRRNERVAFMAGAFVFPGGRVDEDDHTRAGEPPRDAPSRFTDLTAAREWPYRAAAVREVQEEVAVTISPHDLVPFAHWVTPEGEARRYDTRFFVARMPEDQTARHDEAEATELAWLAPEAAIDRCRRGEIMLPPPTWTTLRQLARFATVDDVLTWAATKPIVCVQPALHRTSTGKMLTLPGDPLHAVVPGWDVPEETRFVLEEGRGWTPIRA